MQNFIYKFQQFMYGRNGIDGLGIAILVLSIVARIFLRFLGLILLILFVFRFLSKNLYQRRNENAVFMKYYNRVYWFFKSKSTLAKERAMVKETHKIYLCPKCKRKLKVPKGRGKIEISCPCSHKFYKRT